MKILGISGGTKDGVNDAMTREALMGAAELGAEVEFIHLLDLNIKPCLGCCYCVVGEKNGVTKGGYGGCIIRDDDYGWLEQKLYEADGWVFSMPIFVKGLPSAFECLMDRFGGPGHDVFMQQHSLEVRKELGITDEYPGPDPRAFKERPALYISIGGSDWVKRAAADYEIFGMQARAKTIDNIVLDWGKSVVMEDERVARVHNAGRALAEAVMDPEKATYQGDPGICPNCHSRLFYLNMDAKRASCLVCDAEGEITVQDGTLRFTFGKEQYHRMHTTYEGKGLHFQQVQALEKKRADYKKTPEYQKRMKAYKDFIQPSIPVREKP